MPEDQEVRRRLAVEVSGDAKKLQFDATRDLAD